jgi:DNA-binding XRE family transcriptional regulator
MARPPNNLDPGASPLALFGSELRRYRERAGLSQDQLGTDINYSGSFIGQVERGEKRCERNLAVRADERLGLPEALANLWDKTVKDHVFPSWFDWPIYEGRANMLQTYQLSYVDGLLQTVDYARVVLHGDDAAVEARMARQAILTRDDPPPPRLFCVLDESLLHRQLGSREVMREQLAHLVSSVSDRISIQIVPAGTSGVVHPGLRGSFIVATLNDGSDIAYMETPARGMTLREREDLRTLTESFHEIRSQALPVGMSMDLITRTAEERWS